jgi:hypothetical protein
MGIQITSDEKLRTFQRVNELAGGGKLEIVNGKSVKKCIDIPCYTNELVDAILNTYIKVGIVYNPSNSVTVAQKVQHQIVEDYLYQNNSISSDATQSKVQLVLSAYNEVKSSANTSSSSNTSSSNKSNNSTSSTKTAINTASPLIEEEPKDVGFFSKHAIPLMLVGAAIIGMIYLKANKKNSNNGKYKHNSKR